MSGFSGFVFKDPHAPNPPAPIKKEKEDAMDSLSEQFQQAVSTDDTRESHEFFESRLETYQKQRTPLCHRSVAETQGIRRQKALMLQKKVRNERVSQSRLKALVGIKDPEEDEEEEEEEEEQVPINTHKRMRDSDDEPKENKIMCMEYMPKNKKKKKGYKKPEHFTDLVMYAETMEEIPSDFTMQWVFIISPVGKRCLVTTAKGETIVRTRSGRILTRLQSNLPSGSRDSRSSPTSDYCIMDCIYDADRHTYHVLDILCWKGYSIVDCDTDFRHFWLRSMLDPSELERTTTRNSVYKFKALQPLSMSELSQVVDGPNAYLKQVLDEEYKADGLLFYHKETHYTPGSTPLVCWAPLDRIETLFAKDSAFVDSCIHASMNGPVVDGAFVNGGSIDYD
ncbi:hypothetical protein BDF14DRAFT_1853906 [Spinellus fusiger]|nr:hypothetical protein BDF14DRAFT_1853906 [Spinellus fusiger]